MRPFVFPALRGGRNRATTTDKRGHTASGESQITSMLRVTKRVTGKRKPSDYSGPTCSPKGVKAAQPSPSPPSLLLNETGGAQTVSPERIWISNESGMVVEVCPFTGKVIGEFVVGLTPIERLLWMGKNMAGVMARDGLFSIWDTVHLRQARNGKINLGSATIPGRTRKRGVERYGRDRYEEKRLLREMKELAQGIGKNKDKGEQKGLAETAAQSAATAPQLHAGNGTRESEWGSGQVLCACATWPSEWEKISRRKNSSEQNNKSAADDKNQSSEAVSDGNVDDSSTSSSVLQLAHIPPSSQRLRRQLTIQNDVEYAVRKDKDAVEQGGEERCSVLISVSARKMKMWLVTPEDSEVMRPIEEVLSFLHSILMCRSFLSSFLCSPIPVRSFLPQFILTSVHSYLSSFLCSSRFCSIFFLLAS
mgnify:CR=1 FL=1